jgi:hypothetical protein
MSRYRQTMREALEQVYKKEDKDHEVSMARGELEAIADKATQLAGALQGKSDEGNPLEAWVQSKITKAKDYINSVSDYLMYNPDMKQNEETEVNEKTYGWTLVSKAKDLAKKFANNMTKAVAEIEKLERGLSKNPTVDAELRKYNEEVEIDEKISDIFKANKEGESIDDIAKRLKLSTSMVKKLIGEANIDTDNVDKEKDTSKEKELKIKLDKEKDQDTLEKQLIAAQGQINILKQKLENEKNRAIKPEPNPETGEVPLTIGIAHAEFKKEKEKKEVKEENLQELSKAERDKRIQRAKDMIKYYDAQKKAALKGPNKALAKKMLKNETEIEEVSQKDVDKFHTKLDKLVHKSFGHSSDEKKKEVKEARFEVEGRVDYKGVSGGDDFSIVVDAPNEKAAEKKVEDMLFKHRDQRKIGPRGGRGVDDYEIESVERTSKSVTNKFSTYHAAENDPSIEEALEIKEFTSQMIDRLKKSFSTAPKRISPEQANKLSKHLDRIELNDLRKLVKANIPFVSTVARNKIYKKTGKFEETNLEDRRLYVEAIAGLQKKADKSGMSYSILKQVYDRGMAAWKSGHRPGASQQQWAFARVNSFITKSSGTWGGADKDLAAKVKGSK